MKTPPDNLQHLRLLAATLSRLAALLGTPVESLVGQLHKTKILRGKVPEQLLNTLENTHPQS